MNIHFDNVPGKDGSDNISLTNQLKYFTQYPLLEKFIQAMPIPVMILNEKRQVVFSNQSLIDITGRKQEENIFGLLPGEIFNCANAFKTPGGCGTTEFCSTCGALNAILASKINSDVQECRIIKKDNEALDLRVYSSPFVIGEDRLTVFAVSDISDEKRRINLERIFFHDLLNTAVSIKVLTHSLEEADETDAEDYKQQLLKFSDKLVDEICAQRDIYAAENNELFITLSRCNTYVVMNDIFEMFNFFAGDKKIIIDKNSDNCDFFTDKVLIRRILSNMMKNAVEAAAEKDHIKIGCRQVNENMQFWVHNPGVIDRDVQLQIFQRSFSTKGTGRGIGTYSMKLLCENFLKGKINFTSTPEDGTTFYCTVPLNLD